MSIYTTEVRYICETESGLSESAGGNSVNNIIANSWNKIFDSNFPIFDESYRETLCCKILKHFYLREIGAETVGIWKLWLNTRMEEIMPYYNQLYKSAQLEWEPFYDVDYTRSGSKDGSYSESNSNRGTNTNTRTDNLEEDNTLHRETSENGTNYVLYSDTPQGALSGVESESYLTNATKSTSADTEEVNENRVRTNTGTIKNDGTTTENGSKSGTTEDGYTETIKGKRGGKSYAELLEEYRKTFLNVDMMVIGELEDLFFGLWG